MHVFECKMCGQCCNGRGGIVLSNTDLDRLARHFQMETHEFIAAYGVRENKRLKLKQSASGFCAFFREGNGCSVHQVKPDVCRAWPFFRGNLEDAISFEMAKTYCPGIPRNCVHQDFVAQGLQWLQSEKLVFDARPDTPNALINSHLPTPAKKES